MRFPSFQDISTRTWCALTTHFQDIPILTWCAVTTAFQDIPTVCSDPVGEVPSSMSGRMISFLSLDMS